MACSEPGLNSSAGNFHRSLGITTNNDSTTDYPAYPSSVYDAALLEGSPNNNLNFTYDEEEASRRSATGLMEDSASAGNSTAIPTLADIEQSQLAIGLIPEADFARAFSQPYDIMWIENHGLDASQLQFPQSSAKFPKLFLDGVLQVNDRFELIGDQITAMDDLGSEAVVSGLNVVNQRMLTKAQVVSVSKSSHWYPDLRITFQGMPAESSITLSCKGPMDMYTAMTQKDPRLSGSFGASVWTRFMVWRNGVSLGTLADVRAIWHLWILQIDEWAIRNSQARRSRRVRATEGIRWSKGAYYAPGPDGTMVPLANQVPFALSSQRRRRKKGGLGSGRV